MNTLLNTAQQLQPIDLKTQYGFGNFNSLGELLSILIVVGLSVAGIAVTFYIVLAAFKIVTSNGDKNALGEARGMIMHGIIGLILLVLLFTILQYIPEVLGLNFRIIG